MKCEIEGKEELKMDLEKKEDFRDDFFFFWAEEMEAYF